MIRAIKGQTAAIAKEIRKRDEVQIVTHIDADGIAAGAIAQCCLHRAGIENRIRFVTQLDQTTIEHIKDEGLFTWFTDLGSGVLSKLEHIDYLITDHHAPDKVSLAAQDRWRHLNPHLHGIDGGREISGAGLALTVATAVDIQNSDLIGLSIIGASGDLQDAAHCRFEGWNRILLNRAVATGKIAVVHDVRLFGRQTKPAYKLLQYADDPLLPSLSGRQRASIAFLTYLEVPVKEQKRWRRWIDFSTREQRIVISALCRLLITKGFGHQSVARLVGEVCELQDEETGTSLRDAREFATLLNSTARYGHAEVGLNICLGDRDEYLHQAHNLLKSHRKSIVQGIQFVKNEGIQELESLQYFNAGNNIRDTVVGIIAGIVLHSRQVNPSIPLVGFANKKNGHVKASARTTALLVHRGVDLSKAIQNVVQMVGGIGGGHNIAAGAVIPQERTDDFLKLLNKEIQNQLT